MHAVFNLAQARFFPFRMGTCDQLKISNDCSPNRKTFIAPWMVRFSGKLTVDHNILQMHNMMISINNKTFNNTQRWIMGTGKVTVIHCTVAVWYWICTSQHWHAGCWTVYFLLRVQYLITFSNSCCLLQYTTIREEKSTSNIFKEKDGVNRTAGRDIVVSWGRIVGRLLEQSHITKSDATNCDQFDTGIYDSINYKYKFGLQLFRTTSGCRSK